VSTCELVICSDPETLASRAADAFVRCAADAVRQRGRFTTALSGGSTADSTYGAIARPQRAKAVDWSKTQVFFADERFVPPDDPRSNQLLVQRALLAHVPLPRQQFFPVPTQARSAAEAAAMYGGELARFCCPPDPLALPCFDLIVLGMGADGHTASLFPGALALQVDDNWVTWSPPGTLPPPVDRITLTYPALNAARHVVFVVSGERKAPALREVLQENPDPEIRPAAGVRPKSGTLTWLVDRDAARLLTIPSGIIPIGHPPTRKSP
jgi:6-phosphogluconolactonase